MSSCAATTLLRFQKSLAACGTQDCGVLEELVSGVAGGELDLAALRRRAIRARRRSAHYHLAMSYAVGPGRRSTAIALARRATGIAPDAAHAWHHLGIHLDDAGQVAEAREAHREAARLAPDMVGLLIAYARAQRAAGDYAGAQATAERAAASHSTPEIRRRIWLFLVRLHIEARLAAVRNGLRLVFR